MIHYSSHPDLYKVMEMFSTMSQEDKKMLFFNNEHFFVKLTTLHYKIIKGECLMLVNDEGITVGFVSLDLSNDNHLWVSETYVMPKYRADSLRLLLEMFKHLKLYMRPIHAVLHKDNVRYAKALERMANAIEVNRFKDQVKYVIHI
jgi:hypothetical protein